MRGLTSLAVVLGLLSPGAARAWDAETHYAWTYYVALHTGYSERQAHQVASAAQAVADSPATRIEPTSWETLTPLAEPARVILRDLHCFGKTPPAPPTTALGVLGWIPKPEVAPSGEARLWKVAVETGNPGPLVHYVQDCVINQRFGDGHGHETAGHFPDWIATDAKAARDMTFQTARVLVRFQKEFLNTPTPSVDRDRLFEVLAKIADENPVDRSGIIAETGPENPVTFLEQRLARTPAAHAVDARKALDAELEEKFHTGRPSVDTAIRLLATAIREDKVLERIASFPQEGWEPPALSWLAYELDERAWPKPEGPPWSLERVALSLTREAAITRIHPPAADATDRLYRVELRQPYLLHGVLDLPPAGGVPVRERCTLSDAAGEQVWTTARTSGEHAIVAEVYRPASALAKGLVWTCTVQVHGGPSATSRLEVDPVSAEAVAAEVPVIADPAPLASAWEEARSLYDEALQVAGQVATACTAADATRVAGEADLKAFRHRMEEARAGIARAAKASEAVPGAAERAKTALTLAEAARDATRAAKARMEAAARATCEATSSRAERDALTGHLEATRTARDETATAFAQTEQQVGEVVGIRQEMFRLAAEGRRLQDAVWTLDPGLSALEASLRDARATARAQAPNAARLGELATRFEALSREADAAFKAAGRPKSARDTQTALATLADRTAALNTGWGGCTETRQAALLALQGEVSSGIAAAGEVSTERALLERALPTAELTAALTALYVQARAVQATVASTPGDMIMSADRAATCHSGAR